MKTTLAYCLLTIVASIACDGDSKPTPSTAPTAPSASGKQTGTDVKKLTAEARAGIERALSDYEAVRSKLALDDLGTVAGGAEALQASASAVVDKVPESMRDHLTRLATEAGKLERLPKTDTDAVRKAFGEVSRSAVALLTAEESLRNGLHIFECPMAQGYGKWIQPGETKENPYMGQNMLACGSESDWAE